MFRASDPGHTVVLIKLNWYGIYTMAQPTNPISTIGGRPMSLRVTTVAGLTSPQEFDTSLSLVTRYGRLL
jgi:hypothetical protein